MPWLRRRAKQGCHGYPIATVAFYGPTAELGTLVGANASQQSRVPREQLAEVAQVSRTVQQYLAELEQQNPVAESEEPPQGTSGTVSTTDPDATWTAAKGGPALLAYYDNYLIDTPSRVILAVEATPARFRRVRLRRLWNVAEQFFLAATAQNLKPLVQFLAQRLLRPKLSTA